MKGTLLIAVCFCVQISFAQSKKERTDVADYSSFTIIIGMGKSIANGICIPCHEKKQLKGNTFYVAPGFVISKKLQAKLMAFIWFNRSEIHDPPNSRMNLSVAVDYFPLKRKTLFIQSSLGFGNYFFTPKTEIITSDNYSTRGSVVGVGLATSVGIGYQVPISREVSIVPILSYHLTFVGDLKANFNYRVDNNKPSQIAAFGVGLQFNPVNSPGRTKVNRTFLPYQ